MARSVKQQSRHDAEVARFARRYEREGYHVKADIKGYPQPDTIGGYRPDVVAKKGIARKIVEIETMASVDSARDQKQQATFQNAAKRSKATSFIRKVV